jgi:hypothetical protein
MNPLVHPGERARRARLRACFAALCAGFLLSQTTVAFAQSPDKAEVAQENKRVRELFRKGSKALESRKYVEAQKVLEEAWSIRQTYDVAAALAQAESELGHYAKAANYLDFCLKNIAPAESEQTLQQLQKAFEDVKQHLAVVRITVNRAGAEVSIGDRSVGTSPLPSDLYLEPGTLSVRARHEGLEATDTLVTEAGGQYSLDLSLAEPARAASTPDPVPATPVVPPPSTPRDSGLRDGKTPNLVPVVVGGTVLLLGVGTGLGLHFAATSDEQDADKIRARTGPNGCATGSGNSSDCASLESLAESQDRNRNLSTASFVVAGAALVGTAVYWFWPRGKSEERGRATGRSPGAASAGLFEPRLSAAAIPGLTSVTLSGQF